MCNLWSLVSHTQAHTSTSTHVLWWIMPVVCVCALWTVSLLSTKEEVSGHLNTTPQILCCCVTDSKANESESDKLSCLPFRVPSNFLQKTYFQILKTRFCNDCCTNVYIQCITVCQVLDVGWWVMKSKPHPCMSPSLSCSSAGRQGSHSFLCFLDVFREFRDFCFPNSSRIL